MITFYHSGNCGDILSSLPFCIEYNKEKRKGSGLGNELKFNYTCILNHPASYQKKYMLASHPCGNVQLTKKMFDMLKPLLEKQPYINEVKCIDYKQSIKEDEEHFNLDRFRKIAEKSNLLSTTLTRAYVPLYPLENDIHDEDAWLNAEKDSKCTDRIIFSHSLRYFGTASLNKLVPYQDRMNFIGVPEEYEYMRKFLPKMYYYPVNDFYETAKAINSCALFISNQTMNWWIAEGLKVPRFVLRFPISPNCVPLGRNGFSIFDGDYLAKMLKVKLGY